LPQLLRLLVGIGFFYAIVNWTAFDLSANNSLTRQRFTRMIWIILISAVGLAVYSLFSVEWATYKLPFIPEGIYSYASIWVGDTVHPNVMAGTLVIILPILLGVTLFAGGDISKWQRLIFVFSILSVFLVLIFTQSRGALISFGAALLSLIFLRGRWWGWVVVGGGIFIGSWIIWQTGLERMLDAVLVSATLGGVNGREQIWQRALYMIQDFPFTGVGMGLFGDVADTLYPFAGIETGRIPHAHQLFLQVAVDLGLPGFAAWLTVLGLVILSAWQVYSFAKVKNDRWMAGLGAGLFGSQVALCVHGLLDAVTWGMVRPAPLVWGVWGLTVAAWMLKERV
jgi:putative inorganic carbon (hco3(-)) transporter